MLCYVVTRYPSFETFIESPNCCVVLCYVVTPLPSFETFIERLIVVLSVTCYPSLKTFIERLIVVLSGYSLTLLWNVHWKPNCCVKWLLITFLWVKWLLATLLWNVHWTPNCCVKWLLATLLWKHHEWFSCNVLTPSICNDPCDIIFNTLHL